MNLFAGLEKFGFKSTEEVDLFAEEKSSAKEAGEEVEKKAEEPKEEEFLLEKSIRCIVCDKVFKTKVVKSGKAKRLEPDPDLRPRHLYIDTLKYDVSSCPYCGYTALNRFFEHLTSAQIKLVKEQVCSNFKAGVQSTNPTNDYDKAIEMHKLSLLNAMVKKAKTSEKAYNCLIISWLMRGKIETLDPSNSEEKEKIESLRKEEETFYEQAYDGFIKAISTEMFPICGMDSSTMDYLLAVMSMHFKKYDIASKSLANVITSPSASRKIKDKALELKEEIIKELKQKK